MITIRRLTVLVLGTLGLVATAAGPATAGISFGNHCQPTSLDTIPRTAS